MLERARTEESLECGFSRLVPFVMGERYTTKAVADYFFISYLGLFGKIYVKLELE